MYECERGLRMCTCGWVYLWTFIKCNVLTIVLVCFAETWKDKRHHYLGQCENSRVCGRWKIRWQTKCLSGKFIFHIHASTTKCRGINICTCPYVWNDYDQTFTDGRLWCVVVHWSFFFWGSVLLDYGSLIVFTIHKQHIYIGKLCAQNSSYTNKGFTL